MIALFKTLFNQMGQKIMIYDELIQLLQKEWESVSNYSYDDIQEIMNKKETLVLKMQVLEENRNEVVQTLADKLELRVEEATLKKLITFCPAPVKKKLTAFRQRLLLQIETIADLNLKNQGLLDASSMSIKKSLVFLHMSQDTAESSYQGGGRIALGKGQSKMLNMQA